MENKRIENLEVRKTHNIFTDMDYYEIVKWYPNELYGKQEFFEDAGDGFYRKKGSCYKVSKSVFKSPESCFSIAFFKEDRKEECYNLISVGDRLHKLNENEWMISKQLIDYFYENI